jgi:hypothetical protein
MTDVPHRSATEHSATPNRDLTVALIAVGVGAGAGAVTAAVPALRDWTTVAVGVLAVVLLLAPYVPKFDFGYPSRSLVAGLLIGVGVFQLVAGEMTRTITVLFLLGGTALLLVEQYRLRRGSG